MRTVTTEEGKQYADSINARFIETSVKTRTNVDESFDLIVNDWIRIFSLDFLLSEYNLDDLNGSDETCLKSCTEILQNNVKPKNVQALLWLVIQNEFKNSFKFLLENLEVGHGTLFPINGSYFLHEAVKKENVFFINALLEFHNGTKDLANSQGKTPRNLTDSFDIIQMIYGERKEKCNVQ